MNPYRLLTAFGALALFATVFAAHAQPQYPAYPYAYAPVPVVPPAWSYDPYTSGLSPCPQWRHGDPRCSDSMPPTYGQPGYRQPSPVGAY